MTRALGLAAALLLGILAGEYLTKNPVFRASLGRAAGRGELRALVGPRGIYESDLERSGRNLASLIDEAKVAGASGWEPVSSEAIAHEMDLLRWQFPDEKSWTAALEKAGTTTWSLRRELTANLRARAWLETKLAPRFRSNEEEGRRYFDTHRVSFEEPLRLRASHLFLAAPEGYPVEVIETKRALIDALARRLANGEAFSALVAEYSEDEATKKRAGDLGFLAKERMLPAIFDAAEKLHSGDTSAPVRSRLGFHIIRLTEARSARALTFAEARPEIEPLLANQKRTEAVAGIVAALR